MKKNDKAKNQQEEVVDSADEAQAADDATSEAATEDAPQAAADTATSAEANENAESAATDNSPEARIATLEKENADLKDQLLRRAADFENYRKRMLQEKQDAYDYGNANLLKDLLDSLDNFDRTVEAAATATDVKAIADGIAMINKNLVSMLENKYNLTGYGAVGDEFNPDIHEAIGMQEGDVEKEQLAAVYLKGYKLRDRVIRHAKVMVVKPKEN